MCLSPHEMTAVQLQSEIDWIKAYIDRLGAEEGPREYYEARLENLEALLKDKADKGEMAA